MITALLSALALAPRFWTVNEGGVWWLVRDTGEKVFSWGVCVVDPGTSWKAYDVKNPSYAAYRHYPNKGEWAKETADRLQAWNFNTVGAWSDYVSLQAASGEEMLFAPINHMGSSVGFPWLDMWDPALVSVSDAVCRDQIGGLKRDRRIIGYFSDNELGWWRGAMFKWIWDQKTLGTRERVVDVLKAEYGGDWSKLGDDFDPDGAASFEELRAKGRLYLRAGSGGIAKVQKVMAMLAERYYSFCRDTIQKYDPGALYLGDRYISNFYPEIAEQAGKYCDVVSTNLNPNWNDGGSVRYPLASLEALTGKPLMVTEYYMSAMENRSGNKNDRSGFPVTRTQAQRAAGFTNTSVALARNPNVVGAHWFQFYDEAQNGRGDGENYNFGLVDTSNRPYEALTAAAKKLDLPREHGRAAELLVPLGGVPSVPGGSWDLTKWNRDAAFCPSTDRVPRGDLYCGWAKGGLMLAFYWYEERFPELLYRGEKVPEEDRSTVEVSLPDQKLRWKVRIDGKGGTTVAGPSLKFQLKSDASSSLLLTIPARSLGVAALTPSMPLKIQAAIVSQSRAYATHWRVERSLSK